MRDTIARLIDEKVEISVGFDVINAADVADAVLAAMREPTEAMIWAGRALNTSADITWPAMIDAANA